MLFRSGNKNNGNGIKFEDFEKLGLKIGTVKEIKEHPKADKLYIMKVDLGKESRQIVAGLRPYIDMKDIKGKQVAVATKLEYRKLMGEESQGMILAAGEKEVAVLLADKKVKDGKKVF